MWRILGVAVLSLSLCHAARAQVLEPLGGEFQVNSYTTGDQRQPAVAVGPGGEFVVVWHSYGSGGSDNDGASVQARRYRADGMPIGDQLQVNTTTPGLQRHPVAVIAPDRRLLVLWDGVDGQWYGADGSPLGGEFHAGDGSRPAVAMAGDGDFVVVWNAYGGPDPSSIRGRRFAADGTPLGGEFQVNTYTTGYQPHPKVAAAPAGEFLVTWFSEGSTGSDTSGFSIQARRFDSAGVPQGDDFQVNSYTTGPQYYGRVAADRNGDFLVVWWNPSTEDMRGRKVFADGTFASGEFQVNSDPLENGIFYAPSATADPAGGFLVVWDGGSDTSAGGVLARQIDAGGGPVGSPFQVNTYATGLQTDPAIAVSASSDFVVTWISDGSAGDDADGSSVQAQRYAGFLVFADGFESGGTSAWTLTVP